jgi:hypothetical protein
MNIQNNIKINPPKDDENLSSFPYLKKNGTPNISIFFKTFFVVFIFNRFWFRLIL